MNLGLAANFQGMRYSMNGQTVATGNDVNVLAVLGTNTLGVQILDAGSNVVYQGTYFVTLESGTTGFFQVGAPFALEYNLQALTQAGPPGTPPYPVGPNYPLTVGTPFTPKPYYQYFPVAFP